MEAIFYLSAWGAGLSTILAVFSLYDRTRSRPIVRASAEIVSRSVEADGQFVTAKVKMGPYGDEQLREFYIEFKAMNYGSKPISLQHIYIETAKNLSYLTPDGLPIVLEGQTSALFKAQKEHFDSISLKTKEREKNEILSIGFVDGLDRRYPVPLRQLQAILEESMTLPTTIALYSRKEAPDDLVIAFQTVAPVVIKPRSEQVFSFKQKILSRLPKNVR